MAAEKMRQYIVEHLDEELTPALVSHACGYSERHGARLFRKQFGRGLGEYIRLLRLSAAAQNLAHSGETVLDVALSHRYDSHEGFTKAFTSAFGISPRVYRKGGAPSNILFRTPLACPKPCLQERTLL